MTTVKTGGQNGRFGSGGGTIPAGYVGRYVGTGNAFPFRVEFPGQGEALFLRGELAHAPSRMAES